MKFLSILLLLATFTVQAAQFTGKVIGVYDGDTITVLDPNKRQHKIRLEGIDAPESYQPFGTKAAQALSKKVFGKNVKVVWEKTDTYQRRLGHIVVGNRWINHEMVLEGWAWHYKFYSKDKRLADAETKAKAGRKGLWAGKDPVPPWDFRRGKGSDKVELGKDKFGNSVVYVTTGGTKYHRNGCRFLSKSKIVKTLKDAKNTYTPCKICRPPSK